MELRHLRYFVEAAEAKHFGRAARRVNVVQSTLSMQLRDLEEELGTPLFARVGKSIALTNAGQRLLPEARRILAQAGLLKGLAQSAAKGETGLLRIGYTSLAIATSRLTRDLRKFHQECPEVRVQLQELTPGQQIKRILQGSLDVGYVPDFALERSGDYDVDPLCHCSWSVALPDNHPLMCLEAVEPADLAREHFIVCGSPATVSDTAHAAMMKHLLGFEPLTMQAVHQSLTGFAMVAAGLGVALVPDALSQLSIPYLAFRRFEAATGRVSLALLTRRGDGSGPQESYRRRTINDETTRPEIGPAPEADTDLRQRLFPDERGVSGLRGSTQSKV